MPEEPSHRPEAGDEAGIIAENEPPGQWMPALKAAVALIVVLAVIFCFRPVVIAMIYPFRDTLLSWTTNYDSNPLIDAFSNLIYGFMLLLLAGLFITGKNLPATLSDRRWLALDGLKKNRIVVGLALGIVAFTVATLAITVIHIYQSYILFPGISFPVSVHLEELAVILVMLAPILVMSLGKVALVQGFFQRMLSEKYGAITGALIAAFIFMLVSLFPNHIAYLWSPPFWQINTVIFLTGAVVAYLLSRTKSLYMPMGFLFAWNVTYYFLNLIQFELWPGQFIPVTLVGNYPMPVLDNVRFLDTMYITVAYGTQALALLLTLVVLWYFGNKTRKEIVGLNVSVKNVLADIYERITRN
jgi:membrane protease YdiL (CAAX protease family)